MQRRLVFSRGSNLSLISRSEDGEGDGCNYETTIPSCTLDGIVSPQFSTRQVLPGWLVTKRIAAAKPRERLHAITLLDSAATPPSFIPDKGKSGEGARPVGMLIPPRVSESGRRNSKLGVPNYFLTVIEAN